MLKLIIAVNDVTIRVRFYVEDLQGLDLHEVLQLACPEAFEVLRAGNHV